jgi:hypothetical protein
MLEVASDSAPSALENSPENIIINVLWNDLILWKHYTDNSPFVTNETFCPL